MTAVRRAFEGTIPALTPGQKVGGHFDQVSNGSAPFIRDRDAYFTELFERQEAEKAKLPRVPITIRLPDGSEKSGLSNETTPFQIASEISPGLARVSVVARVRYDKDIEPQVANTEDLDDEEEDENEAPAHKLWDMHRPLLDSCSMELVKFDDKEAKGVFWHSSAHLLGLALETAYGAQLTIGPALQRGFYYDSFMGDKFCINPDNYKEIEAAAEQAYKKGGKFERLEMSKEEALIMFQSNPFKVALIAAKVPDNSKTSCYRCGPFVDLCMGPHIPDLSMVKAFAVEKHSSAYWLGDKDGDSLQRVYAIAFPDSKMMKEHLHMMEEAKKRDHRTLGQQLDLFFFEPNFSPGCAFWMPKGAKVFNKLIDLMRSEYIYRGFQEVHSPNLYSCDLFRVSGHYQNYKENMFLLDVEGKDWGLKPMNCPGHCCIFKHMSPSYRQLPIRMADFGVLHRNEFSGSLSGLTRVRRFQQDDAHIFCQMDQVKGEVAQCLEFLVFIYQLFGFRFELYLATRPKKALGTAEVWDAAEQQLKAALDESGMPWKLNKGDGAFYGPKIDIQLFDALDRGHQCGTVQLDFQLPLRFDLQFKAAETVVATDEAMPKMADKNTQLKNVDGSLETELKPGFGRPVMIHRAILGSIERMTAVVLEHTGGRLPFWLSPRQAIVCPISEKQMYYAQYVAKVLKDRGFDAEVDVSSNTINKKIREAQVQQWNYILVVGGQEEEERAVMVRQREDPKNQTKMSIQALVDLFNDLRDINKRRQPLRVPEFVPA